MEIIDFATTGSHLGAAGIVWYAQRKGIGEDELRGLCASLLAPCGGPVRRGQVHASGYPPSVMGNGMDKPGYPPGYSGSGTDLESSAHCRPARLEAWGVAELILRQTK